MTPSDVRLIDPAFGELATAVLKAARVANGRVRHDRIDKDVPSWHRALRRLWRKPGGWQKWPGPGSLAGTPLVKVSWWTDRLGRKHWRILGTRRGWWEMDLDRSWPPALHELWHVYPERLLWRRVEKREELVAACACGVVGPPAAISWAGLRCGPCHDRLEEGEPVPAGAPWRRERRRHTELVDHAVWLPDGRMVTGGADGRIVLWDDDGASRVLLHRRNGRAHALAASATGLVAACTSLNRLLLLDVNRGKSWRTMALGAGYDNGVLLSFSPDGRWLIATSDDDTRLFDVTVPEPTPRPLIEGQPLIAAVFAAEGETAYGFDSRGGLVRVALASGDVVTVRPAPMWAEVGEALSTQLAAYFYNQFGVVPVLACSADGQWLVAAWPWEDRLRLHRCHLPTGAWAPLRGAVPFGTWRMAFSGADELMVVNGDETVAVWALGEAALKATWCPMERSRYGRTFLSPGGEWLAQAHQGGEVMLYRWRELLHAAG